MTDKDFGRKPKFGPVAKKGSPLPPPKNRNLVGWISLRAIQPTETLAVEAGLKPFLTVLPRPQAARMAPMPRRPDVVRTAQQR